MAKKKVCGEDDPEFESFMDRMKKEHHGEIQRSLAENSDSNTVFEVRELAESLVGDPIGTATGIKEKIEGMRSLGEVEFEIIEEDRGRYYMEAFLTLKDPCSEKLVKRAIDLGFVWLL